MRILVNGGAGYIGSACVKSLIEKGFEVIVIDNLSKGIRELIDKKAKFYEGDLVDEAFVNKVFSENEIDAVIHFASYKAAGESMETPEKYSDNITGLISVLNSMAKYNVKKIIFSSSAAVYGEPEAVPVDENHRTEPINYYGFTKLIGEEIIDWYSDLKGMVGVCLRYFNVAGDAGLKYLDPDAQNVFPILLEVYTGKRDKFIIFGKDYGTKDGSCVRDYVDINDLVRAHILALDLSKSEKINLGTSNGVSVLELFNIFEEVSNSKFKLEFGERRGGDPAVLTASSEKAQKVLGWKPEKDIRDMISSTLEICSKEE
jgi:UDP-glucose 4-epimerase